MCWKSHTHAPCYIKALFQKWLHCSSFSAREIKNRNIHALWMYFPSRKCAVVGVWHWLHTITWRLLPRLRLAGTCGALWGKAFLTGPRSPEEFAGNWEKDNVGGTRRAVGELERWHHHDCESGGAGTWPLQLQQRAGIHRDDHTAEEVQRKINEAQERLMICSNDTHCHALPWSYKFTWHLYLLPSNLTVTQNFTFIHIWFHSIRWWFKNTFDFKN